MIMITTKLNDKPELSPYFPDGTLCHQDDSGSKYYCQVIVVIVIVIMIIMIMIKVTQHIPTMTKSHHGGKMSVTKSHHR